MKLTTFSYGEPAGGGTEEFAVAGSDSGRATLARVSEYQYEYTCFQRDTALMKLHDL